MILILKKNFSSAHFYSQPTWDEARNLETFGRCHTPYGHGHNYRVEVGFQVSAESLATMKNQLEATLDKVIQPLDHEHLNFVIPEFKNKIPTTENITLYLIEKIKNEKLECPLKFLKLFEMDTLWTEIQL